VREVTVTYLRSEVTGTPDGPRQSDGHCQIGETMLLEVCIDSVESAIAAQNGGAQRVELCADLANGGTTPSAGMIQSVREAVSMTVHTMIRPRPGDFCYSDREFDVMMRDVETAKKLGSDGIVFGILTLNRSVDAGRSKQLLEAARPLRVTFHRAIDDCPDIEGAFDEIARLGIDRVLTSGGKPDVLLGADVLEALVKRSHGRLKVLAGGGVSFDNVIEVVKRTGVTEIHALSALSSAFMAVSSSASAGCRRRVVDPAKVRQMADLLNQITS